MKMSHLKRHKSAIQALKKEQLVDHPKRRPIAKCTLIGSHKLHWVLLLYQLLFLKQMGSK